MRNLWDCLPKEIHSKIILYREPHPLTYIFKEASEILNKIFEEDRSLICRNYYNSYDTPIFLSSLVFGNKAFYNFIDEFAEIDGHNNIINIIDYDCYEYRKNVYKRFKLLTIPWINNQSPPRMILNL